MKKRTPFDFSLIIAKEIQTFIESHTDNLKLENATLRAKILNWHTMTNDDEFANYFKISELFKEKLS